MATVFAHDLMATMFWYAAAYFVFATFHLIGFYRVRRYTDQIPESSSQDALAVVIPIKGATQHTRDCLTSWLTQAHMGPVHFCFSFQDEQDPAIPLVRELTAMDPSIASVLINPIKPGFSGKGSNLWHAIEAVRADQHARKIFFVDADIIAPPGTLAKILTQLKPNTLVSCPAYHRQAPNLWSSIYSYFWNTAILCVWAPTVIRGRAIGASGGVIALDLELLERLGGLEATGGCLAEDLALGTLARQCGAPIALGPVVHSPVPAQIFSTLANNLKRGHLILLHFNKISRAFGILSALGLFSYSILPLAGLMGWASAWPLWALVAGIRYYFMATMTYWASGAILSPHVVILGDLLYFLYFFRCWFSNTVVWGGVTHHVGPGAEIVD